MASWFVLNSTTVSTRVWTGSRGHTSLSAASLAASSPSVRILTLAQHLRSRQPCNHRLSRFRNIRMKPQYICILAFLALSGCALTTAQKQALASDIGQVVTNTAIATGTAAAAGDSPAQIRQAGINAAVNTSTTLLPSLGSTLLPSPTPTPAQ